MGDLRHPTRWARHLARARELRSRLASGAVVAWLALSHAVGLSAQLLPLGPEVQVNSYTTGFQSSPQIAMAPDGSYLVFWCCGRPQSEDRSAILGQRFAPDGSRIGPEFAADEFERDYPADVASDGDGDVVLVWGQGSPGCPACSIDYVKGRRFGADGTPLGAQFAISDPSGGMYTGDGAVDAHEDGRFVVVWDDYGVFGRRYDADGDPVGQVLNIAGGGSPALAMRPDGGFVVLWTNLDVRGRRYDPEGAPVGGDFLVAGSSTDVATSPELATGPGGDFVVTWARRPSSSYDYDIEARRFDPDGSPLGPAQLVNTYTTSFQSAAIVRREASDGFVVVWHSRGSWGTDSDSGSVQARRFASDGTPLGGQLQLNSLVTGWQTYPEVAIAPNGDFLVVWESDVSAGSDTDGNSVQLRRFRPPFFTDGVETGDTSRWSAATP